MRLLLNAAIAAVIAIGWLSSSSCGRNSGGDITTDAVPLPRAWPRTPVYPADYAPVAPGSDIEAIAGLPVSIRPSGHHDSWIDISYPAYRATLYLSDTRTASDEATAEAVANRLERMALNAGLQNSEKTEFVTPEGYQATILSTPSGTLTPLQFIAAGRYRVVSGALTIDRLPSSADSLAPTLRAATRDIVHLINRLK